MRFNFPPTSSTATLGYAVLWAAGALSTEIGSQNPHRQECLCYLTYAAVPRIARFTRFLSSGTLKPLYCNGSAPWMAIFPAISAVSSLHGLPITADSTADNRTGYDATQFAA